MPRLRPPQGRAAAAAIQEVKPDDELELEVAGGLPAEPDPVEDPTIALKEQIEALKRSEREARAQAAQAAQEREEAIRRVQQRDAEVNLLNERNALSEAEAIDAALAGSQAEAEAAQQEIEMAAQVADTAAQVKAYRRLARAEANIRDLENGKAALERRLKEAPKVEPQQPQQDALDKVNLPPLAKQWLRKNPEYMHDARKNAKIQGLHWELVDEGYQEYSPEYFDAMEQKLGMRQSPQVVKAEDIDVDDEAPPPRKAPVSAPPSREVPSSSGKRDSRITLSLKQKEAAKIAGISEEEYAKGVLKLREEKANGNYGGAP